MFKIYLRFNAAISKQAAANKADEIKICNKNKYQTLNTNFFQKLISVSMY